MGAKSTPLMPLGKSLPGSKSGPHPTKKPSARWLPVREKGSGPMRPSSGLSTVSEAVSSCHNTIRSASGKPGSFRVFSSTCPDNSLHHRFTRAGIRHVCNQSTQFIADCTIVCRIHNAIAFTALNIDPHIAL